MAGEHNMLSKAIFQLWLDLYRVKCQGVEQKLLALGGTSVFSMDVLVLLHYLLPSALCSQCVGCFPQYHPEIPSLLIKIRKRRAGPPGLSIDVS